jgi:lysyl-tRNA synthetase class 2
MASVFDAISDGYRAGIVDTGREPELLLLLSFLLAFGFIRTSAHLIRAQVRWWPGNVEVGGRHIHHLVWGIGLLLVLGYAAIAFEPGAPWRQLLAIGFGIGIGLTLDEFALWLDLRDVYWLPEGRKSIDAVIVAATAGALLLLGVRIWIDLADDTEAAVKLVVTGSATLGVFFALVNALRGRYVAAAVSLVVPLAGLVLWVVLPPSPHSIWARAVARRPHRIRE